MPDDPFPRSVGILRYASAQRAAVYGLIDLFESASRLHAQATGQPDRVPLEVRCWDTSRAKDALLSPPRPLSALVLPPRLGQEPPPSLRPRVARWIEARHAEGTILCSACAGAFLLAESGLLDGRPATTHWALGDAFAARYPAVRLDTDRLIVDDGDIITAGGLMAWVDLALDLVGRFLGPSTMLATARLFLVDPGGREQRFYRTFSPALTHGDDAILNVQRWLQGALQSSVTVPELAARAGLGERTFLRRFQRATGMKTTEYIQHLRVGRARERLELTAMSQQEVAWDVGYEDPSAFRRVFVKLMGLSPGEYRRRFGCARSA